MRKGFALRSAVLATVSGSLMLLAASARAERPENFVFEVVAPDAGFVLPTGIAFFPDGRLLVIEKAGRAWVVANGVKRPQPLWDATDQVLSNGDRGLLGVAIDPHYPQNHFVYFAYVVDPDSNGVDDDNVAFGRVVRFTTSAADSSVVDPASRAVLIGTTWADAPPSGSESHTLDCLRFANDGTLLVTAGEGALFTQLDFGGVTPELFLPGRCDPYEDIGAFRAQSLSSLGGKVLRIDPLTGHGLPSNPYWDGNPQSKRSKVWLYGMRNPWRLTVRPGTGAEDPALGRPGQLYVGNLGQNTWETLIVTDAGGLNAGWPCFEGPEIYSGAPFMNPPHNGCGSLGTPDNPAPFTPPAFYLHHADSALSVPAGQVGNAITAGVFYTSATYPPDYQGAYFFANFGNEIRVAHFDSAGAVLDVRRFADDATGPVDFAIHPLTGDVYYVAIYESEVRRIRWDGPIGGNAPPFALAVAGPLIGPKPLTVGFIGHSSVDPEGGPLAYEWTFGDGAGSTLADPTHTYTASGVWDAVLTVTDPVGAVGRDTLRSIVLESAVFPTTAVVDSFNHANGPLGSLWTGLTSALRVVSGRLQLLSVLGWAVWQEQSFGPEQEAYFTFVDAPVFGGQYNLYLKTQGSDIYNGCIRARLTGPSSVQVSTFTPGHGWSNRGGPVTASFAAGDRFGVRVFSNSIVQLLKNGVVYRTVGITGWPFERSGGGIGLELAYAIGARIDNFGGGNAVVDGNLPPVVGVVAPADSAFYWAGESVSLTGTASDARDAASSLDYLWTVDLLHNNHVHPSVFVATGAETSFVAQNHDDGTGVSYRVTLRVTDTEGLFATGSVSLFPEIDLAPRSMAIDPDTLVAGLPGSCRFMLVNSGRMPSPTSRWRLTVIGGVFPVPVTLAEGDTLVPASSAISLAIQFPAILGLGTYTFRLTADTLNAAHETNEGDNAILISKTITTFVASAPPSPIGLALSAAQPNPSRGAVELTLDLPQPGTVEFTVLDVQGRAFLRSDRAVPVAGRSRLTWDGRRADGTRAPAGLYLARVRVRGGAAMPDRIFLRRFVVLS